MVANLKQRIGLRVRHARRERGLSQEQLAEKIERSVETVSLIERGQTLPALETLARVAIALGTQLREMFPEFDPAARVQIEGRPLDPLLRHQSVGRKQSPAQLDIAVPRVEALALLA